MKIGIITDFIDENAGGIATYTYNLIKNLNIIDKKNTYYLIHNRKSDLDIYRNNKEVVISSLKVPFRKTIWRFLQLPLYLFLFGNKYDIIHDPYEIPAFSYLMPKTKKIITIHDLSGTYSEFHTRLNVIFHKLLLKKALSNIDAVITDSNYSKEELIKYYKFNSMKINVIYLGVGDNFISKKINNKTDVNKIRLKYKLPNKFILFVGNFEPRKNIQSLIKAYSKLVKINNIALVIVSRHSWKDKSVSLQISKNKFNNIILLNNVIDEDLPYIYSLASLFVYLSLYEGFGLPILEAMACGCPVVASNTTSIPEVVGDSGILVDPSNIDIIANSMDKVLSDSKLSNVIIKKSLHHAKKYSWKQTAKKTLLIYNSFKNDN